MKDSPTVAVVWIEGSVASGALNGLGTLQPFSVWLRAQPRRKAATPIMALPGSMNPTKPIALLRRLATAHRGSAAGDMHGMREVDNVNDAFLPVTAVLKLCHETRFQKG